MSQFSESTAREQSDPTVGALVHDLSQQVPELIRSELRLAQAEMAEKGKRAGLGIGERRDGAAGGDQAHGHAVSGLRRSGVCASGSTSESPMPVWGGTSGSKNRSAW